MRRGWWELLDIAIMCSAFQSSAKVFKRCFQLRGSARSLRGDASCGWLASTPLSLIVSFQTFFYRISDNIIILYLCASSPISALFFLFVLHPKNFMDSFCCSQLAAPGQHCCTKREPTYKPPFILEPGWEVIVSKVFLQKLFKSWKFPASALLQ